MDAQWQPDPERIARALDALYRGLLASPCAAHRVEGVDRWREHGQGVAEITPLLADDAPVLIGGARHPAIAEVRAAALVAVQDSYRARGAPWDLGPATVRAAKPVGETLRQAQGTLAGLGSGQRRQLRARAGQLLAQRVQPPPADEAACRAYLILQLTGQIRYEVQDVDPATLLTPLQQQVHARQAAGDRPRPHVRFDGPDGPIGYFYRREGRWVTDLSEHPLAADVRRRLQGWRSALRGGVPRLALDEEGTPRRDHAGHLITDGTVAHDTDDPLPYLHSIATFLNQSSPALLVT